MPLSPIVAGHLLEVKVYTSFRNQLGLNVVHMHVNSCSIGATTQDIVAQVEADWNGSWKALLNSEAEWRGIGIRDLTVSPLEVEVFSGLQRDFGGAGAPLPGQLCYLITKRTAIAGAKGRGRMYVPFPGTAFLADITAGVHATGITALTTLINDIKGPEAETAGGITVNWTLVLRTPVIGSDPFSSTPLLSITPEGFFASQRRRGAYGTLNQMPGPLQ
jgi:hypothetical protein